MGERQTTLFGHTLYHPISDVDTARRDTFHVMQEEIGTHFMNKINILFSIWLLGVTVFRQTCKWQSASWGTHLTPKGETTQLSGLLIVLIPPQYLLFLEQLLRSRLNISNWVTEMKHRVPPGGLDTGCPNPHIHAPRHDSTRTHTPDRNVLLVKIASGSNRFIHKHQSNK